jgi:hypothetical protein
VGVRMAFEAKLLAGPVSRLQAFCLMTFDAGECGVLSNQRKGAAGVGFTIKKRRSEFRCPVTRRTIRAGCSRCKLPIMRIRMAILAEFMGDRSTEISFLMAFNTRKFRMFSDQPEYCQIVIKTPGGTIEILRIVALFALASGFRILECALMLVRVAVSATAERQPFKKKCLGAWNAFWGWIPGLHIGFRCRTSRGMAFPTGNLLMPSGEWKSCNGMAEFRGRAPARRHVAFGAVRPKLALVRLAVARSAFPAQSEEGSVEIFHLDFGAGGRHNFCRVVAVLALLLAMAAFQYKPCLAAMIKVLPVEGNQ